jgi:hypothetical protein
MRRLFALIGFLLIIGSAAPAFADPSPPTNGGSANGGGSSGQCTGDMDSRPAACHNGNGAGN